MLNVVFSDSARGVLISALSLMLNRDSRDVSDTAKDVVKINIALDTGPINCDFDDGVRKRVIASLFEAGARETPEVISDRADRYWDSYLRDCGSFLNRARRGEPIRIWYSEAPNSLCGFYATAAMLAELAAPVSAVKLPAHILRGGELKLSDGWGEISPSYLTTYLCLEESYTNKELQFFSACWEKLKRENAPLRAIINGRLHSVPENFYDTFILNTVDCEALRVAEIILKTMHIYHFGIGDALIASRIAEMIRTGKLRIVSEEKSFYDSFADKSGVE